MPRQRQKQPKARQWLTGARIIGFAVALLLLLVGGILWILEDSLGLRTGLFSIAFTIASVIIGLFQIYSLFFPSKQEPPPKPDPVAITPALPPISIHLPPYPPTPTAPALQMPTDTDGFMGIHASLPLTDPRTIQQRENVVKEIYAKLMQPDISAVILIGIAGVGKSTLAALVYKYVETRRIAGKEAFQAEPVWLRVEQNTTLADLAGNLFTAFGKPQPDLDHLTPANQALELVKLLNTADTPRLIVLDQFEHFLDWETGHVLRHRGVGELLDALNSQACHCRVLLTSRVRPKGIREDLPTYFQTYRVDGLPPKEGVTFLHSQGVIGSEVELRTAVERSDGHSLALKLLVALVSEQRLSLSALLANPQLWDGDIATKLLDPLYQKQLSTQQRHLLQAFSVYREAVPQEAAQRLLAESARGQILPIIRALLTQSLLEAAGEGRYRLHSIVAHYVHEHFVENDEQANQQAIQAAHAKAAQYYLQQAAQHSPPREQRRRVKDVAPLIEAVWQWCQARQWRSAFDLLYQEGLFDDLSRWGGEVILLELMLLLWPLENWHPDPAEAFFLNGRLGVSYQAIGQPQKALDYFEAALALHREGGYGRRFGSDGEILKGLGRAYETLGQKQKALDYYQQALASYRTGQQLLNAYRKSLEPHIPVSDAPPKMKKGLFRRRRATMPGNQESVYLGPSYSEVLLGIRREEGDMLYELGGVYFSQRQLQEALSYFEQALAVYSEVGDHKGKGTTLNDLGAVYLTLKKKQEALSYFEQALAVHRKINNLDGEGTTLNNMGNVYQSEEALSYFEQALAIYRGMGNRIREGDMLNNLGNLYHALGKPEKALSYFEQTLAIYREIGNRDDAGIILNRLGSLYNDLGQSQKALDYFKQSLINRREVGDRHSEITELWNIGVLYSMQGRNDIALACFLVVQSTPEGRLNPTSEEIQKGIENLQDMVGEEAFVKLRTRVESRVEEMLREELR